MTRLRERKWLTILRNAETGDVAIMHPGHANYIAPKLGIPRKKVVWFEKIIYYPYGKPRKLLHWRRLKKLNQLRDLLREQRRKKPM